MKVRIDPRGTVRALYSEALDHRASTVEPDAAGCWWADLGPSGGPVLGPFGRRSEALAAEVRWLECHRL